MKHQSEVVVGITEKNRDTRMLSTDISRPGQVLVGANGRRIITEARPDLLDSNKGRTFYKEKSNSVGYVGGADFVTNSHGERVIANSAADDTNTLPAEQVNAMKVDRRRKVAAAQTEQTQENG